MYQIISLDPALDYNKRLQKRYISGNWQIKGASIFWNITQPPMILDLWESIKPKTTILLQNSSKNKLQWIIPLFLLLLAFQWPFLDTLVSQKFFPVLINTIHPNKIHYGAIWPSLAVCLNMVNETQICHYNLQVMTICFNGHLWHI